MNRNLSVLVLLAVIANVCCLLLVAYIIYGYQWLAYGVAACIVVPLAAMIAWAIIETGDSRPMGF